MVARCPAVEAETVIAIQGGKAHGRGPAAGLAEYDIDRTGRGVAARRGQICPDDEIGDAVAVDVARGQAAAGIVAGRHAVEEEAVGAVEEGGVDCLVHRPADAVFPRRAAEDDIGRAGRAVDSAPGDDDIGDAVAINVATRYRPSDMVVCRHAVKAQAIDGGAAAIEEGVIERMGRWSSCCRLSGLIRRIRHRSIRPG